MSSGGNQMEVLGECGEQELGSVAVKVEERDAGLVVAEHYLHALVVEVVVNTVGTIRIAAVDSDCHRNLVFMVYILVEVNSLIQRFTLRSPHGDGQPLCR